MDYSKLIARYLLAGLIIAFVAIVLDKNIENMALAGIALSAIAVFAMFDIYMPLDLIEVTTVHS